MSGPAGLRCCCCCCCCCCWESLTLQNYTTRLFTEFNWRHNRWRSTLLLPLTDQINNHQHHGGLLKVCDVTHRAASWCQSAAGASQEAEQSSPSTNTHTGYLYSHWVLIFCGGNTQPDIRSNTQVEISTQVPGMESNWFSQQCCKSTKQSYLVKNKDMVLKYYFVKVKVTRIKEARVQVLKYLI